MTPYTKQIVELHKIHKAIENCGCNKDEQGGGDENSGNLLMSLIPSDYPKPDLFVFQLPKQEPIDVTNYKIDNFLNLLNTYEQDELTIRCLYESSDFGTPIINYINFGINGPIYFSINFISNGNVVTDEVSYNNKTYYYYRTVLI